MMTVPQPYYQQKFYNFQLLAYIYRDYKYAKNIEMTKKHTTVVSLTPGNNTWKIRKQIISGYS